MECKPHSSLEVNYSLRCIRNSDDPEKVKNARVCVDARLVSA